MDTIAVPKKEYEELIKTKLRYEYLEQVLRDDIFSPPSTKNAKEILKTMEATQKYSQKFLLSLEKGLKRSSYFQL